MSVETILIFGAALPGAVAAVLYVVTRRAAAAVGLAWLAARSALNGWSWPGLPAHQSEGWIPWLVLAAVVVSLVPKRVPGRWLGGLLLCAAAPWALLRNTVKDDYVLLGALGGAVWVWSLLVQGAARARPGITVPLVLAVVAGGAAIVFERGNSIALAQQSGALAAACGSLVLFAKGRDPQEIALPAAMVMAGLLLNAYYYGYPGLPLPAVLLVAAAPAAAFAGSIPGLRHKKGWIRVAACAAAAAAMVATAVAIAHANAPEPNPYR